jgi:hypothetical protein
MSTAEPLRQWHVASYGGGFSALCQASQYIDLFFLALK